MEENSKPWMLILKQRFGERFQTSEAVRRHHCNSTTWLEPQLPDCVVFPETSDEIGEILRVCNEYSTPVIAFGAGSSVEGHVNAPFGGVSVDMSKMDSVLDVIPEDLIAVVQPGVTRKRLNEELRATGLHFPIDPGADASIGGMVSTRASGTEAVKYGTMADNILSLKVVTADGSTITTGTRAKKSAAGYDLTRLFTGAEGTLGIITEVTVKLRGIPDHVVAGTATFRTVEDACNAAISAIQMGLNVGRIELLDSAQISACNRYSHLDLEEVPTLFFEFSGLEDAVNAEMDVFHSILGDAGTISASSASAADERNQLWRARHDAWWASLAAFPGKTGLVTDACVPISKLADSITAAQSDLSELGLDGMILGHVGDGNFHVVLMVDQDDDDEKSRINQFLDRNSSRAIEYGGTCSGEHGIGQGKRDAFSDQAGAALDVMAKIKDALDPNGILNPGKVLAD